MNMSGINAQSALRGFKSLFQFVVLNFNIGQKTPIRWVGGVKLHGLLDRHFRFQEVAFLEVIMSKHLKANGFCLVTSYAKPGLFQSYRFVTRIQSASS